MECCCAFQLIFSFRTAFDHKMTGAKKYALATRYRLWALSSGETCRGAAEKIKKELRITVSPNTISQLRKKMEKFNDLNDLPRCGRPRITTETGRRLLIRTTRKHRSWPSAELANSHGEPYFSYYICSNQNRSTHSSKDSSCRWHSKSSPQEGAVPLSGHKVEANALGTSA